MNELNPEKAFETIKNNVVSSISSYFPYEGRLRKVVLNKIDINDKLKVDDLKTQAEAKNLDRTWGVPIKADVSLIDKTTGKTLDRKQLTLARLPKITNRYGYIVDGNEYQVDNLFRLKSGVYSRVQADGDLVSEFNLAKKPAGNFSIYLDRKNKKFFLRYANANMELYPILKSMGVSEDDLEKTWGKEVLDANRSKTPEKFLGSLQKFHERMAPEGHKLPSDLGEHAKFINDYFDQTALRPDTTKVTLGKPFTKVTGETLYLATNKLIDISKQTQQPDDRDSLVFKEIASAENFLPENILKSEKSIKGKLRHNIDRMKNISEIVTPDLFRKPIHEFFTRSRSMAERSEQTNPVQMLSGYNKTTLISPEFGGIKKEQAITPEMRAISPSHFGFLDPLHSPESERIGITLHLSASARKKDKDLESPVFNIKTGKTEYMKVPDFHEATIVLPDQVKWKNGKPIPLSKIVKVKLPGGSIETRPFSEASYVMPSAKGVFGVTSNLIPFLPSDQGNRSGMADKQIEQAVSLKYREAPLVQSKSDYPKETHTFEDVVGSISSHIAPVSGKITDVKSDSITISDGKKKHTVHTYNNFPLNDPKGVMHSEALVKPGDTVKAGQVIADSNFTKNGKLALGTNLRVAYIPYRGYNFEDGVVISESAAKKLTSEHLYKKKLELDPDRDVISKQRFLVYSAVRSKSLSKDQIDALDDNGIVRVGSRIKPGSILVAAVGKNTDTKQGSILQALGKKTISPYKDKSLVWDQDYVGVVTKIIKDPSGKGIKIHVKTEEPMQVGDKITGRHGNKGIVTSILPDHEMPFTLGPDKEKKHIEVLLNPNGVPSRINTGQILETASAKIAEKISKPYIVNNFSGPNPNYSQQVLADLKKHGISDEELVYDPKDPNKPLGSILVGPQYILKLHHQVEKKLSVRGAGTDINNRPLPYSTDLQPIAGHESGGQAVGSLDLYCLLGHNARHNLREMATYKSDFQDQTFWNLVQEGHEPPPPKTPFAYEKFVGLLNGLGVNVHKMGTALRLQPLTDKQIIQMAGGPKGEIKNANMILKSRDLRPEKGGLFDEAVTGGPAGNKWGFIRLAEPIPNPIFVGAHNKTGPVPTLLNMKLSEVEDVIKGKLTIDGKTGGEAIKSALAKIDVNKEINSLKSKLSDLKGAALDRANKKLKYLLALKEVDMKPHEAYVLTTIPVVPPVFRPYTTTPKGDIQFNSLNGLYKNIATLNNDLKEFDRKTFTKEHKNPIRGQLYEGLKALESVGGAVGYDTGGGGGRRKLKGILDIIGGGEDQAPKEAFFQSNVISRRQNLSIRSTIVPEPKLALDEVGLPKGAAMELYKPFVVAEMGRYGFRPLEAQEEAKKGTDTAFKALAKVIEDRPLIVKRDPSLHKFSVMAFKPILVEGKAIQIHPLVTGGFNADFDGDAMAGYVPLTREAVEEAKRMFPSKNLFSPTTGEVMYMPTQEAMLGLHLLSQWGKKTGKTFSTVKDLESAVSKGQIGHNDVVKVKQIGPNETTFGRILIESRLPRAFEKNKDILHNSKFLITKSTIKDSIAPALAKVHGRDFAKVIDNLKDLGNENSYKLGFSFGLKDILPIKERDQIIAAADKQATYLKKSIKNKEELDRKLIVLYQDATKKIDESIKKYTDNRFAKMVFSGSKGKPEQLRQIIAAPMLMQDYKSRTIPTPVTKSYSEGLDIGSYWLAQHGARKGTIQRALGTAEPGSMSKDIINTTMSTLIVSDDCKTNQGLLMDLTHKDILDRFTAANYKLKDGTTIKKDTLITPEVQNRLRNNKIDKILIRSPLKCAHGDGICSKCFGLSENGKLHDVGINIGVLAGQAMGEPVQQMALDAFHTGGIATGRGALSVSRFDKLRNLLRMPERLKNAATLSRASGKITGIEKDPIGGVNVFIGKERHYVPANIVNPELKVGLTVKKGDSLSHPDAPINPHHLLGTTKDIRSVQNFLTNSLYNGIYEKEGVRRRNLEVAVRSLTNLTRVTNPGGSDWIHGDIVPLSIVEEFNRKAGKTKKPIIHEPVLKGVEQVQMSGSRDWLARLNYRDLSKTIATGASQAWVSDTHGSHPIPAYAVGKEFGKPPLGKPRHAY